ncbi:Laminin subunit alpha-1 [Lemmus lemmus]
MPADLDSGTLPVFPYGPPEPGALPFGHQNCRNHKAGDHCEMCARGLYRKLIGLPRDCTPCTCPHPPFRYLLKENAKKILAEFQLEGVAEEKENLQKELSRVIASSQQVNKAMRRTVTGTQALATVIEQLHAKSKCLGDVAGTLVPEWSKSIGSSNTVDISRLLCTFPGLCTEVEATLFLVAGGSSEKEAPIVQMPNVRMMPRRAPVPQWCPQKKNTMSSHALMTEATSAPCV